MKKLLKILLIIAAIIFAILVAGYLTMRYMPEKNISKKDTDYRISSSEIAKEFETAPASSDKKYIDRIIETTGTIAEISTDENNSIVFILRDEDASTGVLCTMSDESRKKASQYKIGDTIKIKGTCTGMLFEVVLNKCIIVE